MLNIYELCNQAEKVRFKGWMGLQGGGREYAWRKRKGEGAHKRNEDKEKYVFCVVTSPYISLLSMQTRNEATPRLGLPDCAPLWGALRGLGITFTLSHWAPGEPGERNTSWCEKPKVSMEQSVPVDSGAKSGIQGEWKQNSMNTQATTKHE